MCGDQGQVWVWYVAVAVAPPSGAPLCAGASRDIGGAAVCEPGVRSAPGQQAATVSGEHRPSAGPRACRIADRTPGPALHGYLILSS